MAKHPEGPGVEDMGRGGKRTVFYPEGVSPIVIWVQQERMNVLVSGRHCRLGALSPVLTLTDLALKLVTKLIADEVLSGLDLS